MQGKVPDPLLNDFSIVKYKYKKGELKSNNIIINGLQYHLLVYIGIFEKF